VNSKLLVIGVIALTWGKPLPAQGQRVSTDAAAHTADKPYVQATGQATISAKPDQAVIEIGVISQGVTALAAAAQNAKQTDAVVADLARLLGGNKKLRTTSYSVHPNYESPKPGAAVTITGYTATNVVEATLDDLALVSKVIDTAAASGANLVQTLQFQLKNRSSVHAQALREATAQAKTNAEAMAVGLGLKMVRVLSAEEVTPEKGFPIYERAAPMALPAGTTPPTPVEIGMIEVAANVVLRVEIGQ
jgi:uncharacterized protein YggE